MDWTYFDPKPCRSRARLDRFYINASSTNTICGLSTLPRYSDHAIITMHMNFNDTNSSCNWILKSDVLRNDDFQYQVKQLLSKFITQCDKNFSDYDRLKFAIKTAAISTSIYLKKERMRMMKGFAQQCQKIGMQSEMRELYSDMANKCSLPQVSPDILFKMAENKSDIKIDKVLSDKNVLERSRLLTDHFRKKYDDTQQELNGINAYLTDLPTLNQSYYDELNQAYEEEEIFNAIKNLQQKKSPGQDGLTNEFYQTFSDY